MGENRTNIDHIMKEHQSGAAGQMSALLSTLVGQDAVLANICDTCEQQAQTKHAVCHGCYCYTACLLLRYSHNWLCNHSTLG